MTDLSKTQGGDLLLHETPAEGRVGDPDTLEVEVSVRVFVQEVGDIGNVCNTTSIGAPQLTPRRTHNIQHTAVVRCQYIA